MKTLALALVLMLASFPAFAAPIDASGLLGMLVTLIIVGLILYLFWWLISYVALPAPFDKVARVIIALVAVLFLVNLLLGLIGKSFISF